MARGHFATSLYASLSRSQIDFGGPSTFGLEVAKFPYPYDPDGKVITQEEMIKQKESTRKDVLGAKNGSSFCLGSMIDRGCFNYRWSVTEYYLDLHPNQEIIEIAKKKKREASQGIQGTKESEGNGKTQSTSTGKTSTTENQGIGTKQHTQDTPSGGKSTEEKDKHEKEDTSQGHHVGTCQMFSCAKGQMFYQVLRIEELRAPEGEDFDMSFPTDSQIVLTMGGPVCK